jgi:uncharacterized membrane protein
MHRLEDSFRFFSHHHLAVAIASFPIPAHLFWPYFAGVVLLAMGLAIIFKNELAQRRGIEKILPFGRLFLAAPMAVFGADHLTDASNISRLVPSWMPAPMFWTYLVGVALIAAALSITLKRHARLAAILLGTMFLLFVVMMHIPIIVGAPRERISWVIAFRDLSFGGGAFAFAGSQMRLGRTVGAAWLVTYGRVVVGAAALFFGVQHFLHPTAEPGFPLDLITPTWIPGHLFWTYLAGAVFVACGACILVNVKTRLAATYVGIMVLVLVLFIYLPILFSNPSDVDLGLNSVFDTLALSGEYLVLADAIHEPTSHVTSV